MARKSVPSFVAAVSAFALLAACSGGAGDAGEETAAAPAGDAPAEIKQRQENFEAIFESFKAIRAQLETGEPDFAVLTTASTNINERFQRLDGFFPEGTSMEAGYDTEALATIWEDPEGFEEATANAIAASADLVTAVESGDVAEVAAKGGALGLNGCKGCHDKYRVEQD